VNEYLPQHVSNTVWAYATACHEAPEFFDALANHAPNHIDAFDPQGLANSVWAYATAGAATGAARDSTRERRCFFHFFETAARRRRKGPPTSRAAPAAGHDAPHLFKVAARATVKKIDSFKTRELASVACGAGNG
jgi:hypothetical protein